MENGSDSWRESTIIREQKYVEVCRKSDAMLKLTGGFLIILAGSLLGGCLAWEQDLSGNEISAGTDATASGRIVVFENDAS